MEVLKYCPHCFVHIGPLAEGAVPFSTLAGGAAPFSTALIGGAVPV